MELPNPVWQFLSDFTHEQWQRFIIWFIVIGIVYWRVHFKEDESIKQGFRGENGLWEVPEVVVYAWFWLWPVMLLSSYLFKWPIPDQIFDFMELILFVALGLRGVLDTAKIVKNGHSKETPPPAEEEPKKE